MLPRFHRRDADFTEQLCSWRNINSCFLFTNKPRAKLLLPRAAPHSNPAPVPSLSAPRRWIGTPRSLQFNMFKIQGSFLCLGPFLINFWVSVFHVFFHFTEQNRLLSWPCPERWRNLCKAALNYHWVWFWDILIISDIEILLILLLFINVKLQSNPL